MDERRAQRQTILWVEDDAEVRSWIREVFEMAGYRLLEAGNGAEALTLVEREKGGIDLVVSDVMMPVLSGPEFVRKARHAFPGLRVLFVTAFAELGHVREELRGERVLEKPFSSETLLDTVRELLGAVHPQTNR